MIDLSKYKLTSSPSSNSLATSSNAEGALRLEPSTTRSSSSSSSKPTTQAFTAPHATTTTSLAQPLAPTAKPVAKLNLELQPVGSPSKPQQQPTAQPARHTGTAKLQTKLATLDLGAFSKPAAGAATPEAAPRAGIDLSRFKLASPSVAVTNPALATAQRYEATKSAWQAAAPARETTTLQLPEPTEEVVATITEALGNRQERRVEKQSITYEQLNEQQRAACDQLLAGGNFILNGSAGTGKTTTQRVSTQLLLDSGKLHSLDSLEHKTLPRGIPSIAILSYMNKATENIRAVVPPQFKNCVCTIHKFLEYAPVNETKLVLNPTSGEYEEKEYQIFRPQRNATNLVEGFTHIIIEEASTVSEQLYEELLDALPNRGADITIMLMGDICQILPAFGESILRRSLPTWKAISLTEVYRQALESPILRLAVDINSGAVLTDDLLASDYHTEGELELYNFNGTNSAGKRRAEAAMSPQQLVNPLANSLATLLINGEFVPFRDVILCPFRRNTNDGINCELINLKLAQAHGVARDAEVHEVVAGFHRRYLAIGDPVMVQKRNFTITNIKPNPKYTGIPARPASTQLDRYGRYHGSEAEVLALDTEALDQILAHVSTDVANAAASAQAQDEERKLATSHIVVVRSHEIDEATGDYQEFEISGVGDMLELDFAYAMSVHKSIGSEWEKVYFILHDSMRGMCNRELVYTAVTRAKKYLRVFYSGASTGRKGTLHQAAVSPRIKGNSFAEKVAFLVEQEKLSSPEGKASLLGKFAPLGSK